MPAAVALDAGEVRLAEDCLGRTAVGDGRSGRETQDTAFVVNDYKHLAGGRVGANVGRTAEAGSRCAAASGCGEVVRPQHQGGGLAVGPGSGCGGGATQSAGQGQCPGRTVRCEGKMQHARILKKK